MLNLKTTIIYFMITFSAKIVHTFAVSSMVKGYHKYKDVWNAPSDRAQLSCERKLDNPRDNRIYLSCKSLLITYYNTKMCSVLVT